MAINFKKIWTGLTVVPKTTSTSDSKGELEVIDSTGKLQYHNGTSVSPVLTEAHSATITNKVIDADDNTISDLEVDNLKAGVLNTDLSVPTPTDDQIPSALAVKTYVDASSGDVQADVDDLITLTGVPANSTDLGSFTGTIIPNASDIKEALQALETFAETDAANLAAHIADTIDAHDASAISTVPSGNFTSTDAQSGFLELQGDIDTFNTSLSNKVTGPASATDEAIARFDSTTGKLVQNSVVTITDAGIAAGFTGITSSGTVDSTGILQASGAINASITTDSASTGANATVPVPATTILRLTNASLASIDMISSPTAGRIITLSNQTGTTITVNNDTGATAANRIYTGTGANLTLKNQATLMLEYDSTATRWLVIGGTGAGTGSGINYIINSDAEAGTTGWATYADAAGVIPVDGTGGSPNVTLATSSSSPLRGLQSFLFTKDAANRQGQGASYAFTIDRADMGQVLRISMNYETSTNYVDTVSGNLINSDMQVFVYDVTNSQLIYTDTQNISAVTGEGSLVATFQTNSNSTSYRLIFHVASTNATSYTLKFDNVVVGPQTLIKGAVITDWISYTPIFTGFGTVSSPLVRWRRNGGTLELQGRFTTGTLAASTASISLPTGLNIDPNLVSGATTAVGTYFRTASASSHGGPIISIQTTSSNTLFFGDPQVFGNGLIAPLSPVNGTAVSNNNETLSINISVPIQGWSSNLTLSEDAGNRLVASQYFGNSGQSLTANTTNIPFSTAVYDYTGSWNGSQFTAPETGIYLVTGGVRLTTATAGDIYGYIDGVSSRVLSLDGVSTIIKHFSGQIRLIKGQVFSIRTDINATLLNASNDHGIAITKASSPQTLAGGTIVAARASQTSGQSIPNNSETTITWDSAKTYDTHGALNTATGQFIAPETGFYIVQAKVTFANATTGTRYGYLHGAGGQFFSIGVGGSSIPGNSNNFGIIFNDIIFIPKGQEIYITAFQGSGGAVALKTNGQENYIAITKVGN